MPPFCANHLGDFADAPYPVWATWGGYAYVPSSRTGQPAATHTASLPHGRPERLRICPRFLREPPGRLRICPVSCAGGPGWRGRVRECRSRCGGAHPHRVGYGAGRLSGGIVHGNGCAYVRGMAEGLFEGGCDGDELYGAWYGTRRRKTNLPARLPFLGEARRRKITPISQLIA